MQQEKAFDGDSLGRAKQFLRANWKEGCKCPCCGQRVQLYKRSVTSAMAAGLALIVHRVGIGADVHLESFFKDIEGLPSSIRGDMTKWVEWGMLAKTNERGVYRATDDARQFLCGMKTNRFLYFYNGKVQARSVETITYEEALQNKFDIQKLLKPEGRYLHG